MLEAAAAAAPLAACAGKQAACAASELIQMSCRLAAEDACCSASQKLLQRPRMPSTACTGPGACTTRVPSHWHSRRHAALLAALAARGPGARHQPHRCLGLLRAPAVVVRTRSWPGRRCRRRRRRSGLAVQGPTAARTAAGCHCPRRRRPGRSLCRCFVGCCRLGRHSARMGCGCGCAVAVACCPLTVAWALLPQGPPVLEPAGSVTQAAWGQRSPPSFLSAAAQAAAAAGCQAAALAAAMWLCTWL